MIHFHRVTKRFPGGQSALEDVSFDIPRGQFVFLTGASGSGKTTLLRLIFREETPSEGQILVNGRNVASIPASKIPFLRRSIGVVFQDFRLIPRKTIFENVIYLPRILGLDLKEQKKVAFHALRRVGLAHRANAFPLQLSGGEQQRVAIARALVNEPEILIADEPTGNLDPDLSWEILRLFLEVNLRGTTVLLATHDRATIERIGRRVLTLDGGRLRSDVELVGNDPPDLSPRAWEGVEAPREGDRGQAPRAWNAVGGEAAPEAAAGLEALDADVPERPELQRDAAPRDEWTAPENPESPEPTGPRPPAGPAGTIP